MSFRVTVSSDIWNQDRVGFDSGDVTAFQSLLLRLVLAYSGV